MFHTTCTTTTSVLTASCFPCDRSSLDEQDLQGTVPAEWSALAQLQSVSLRSNRLTGDPIPSSWSVLDRLALMYSTRYPLP